MEVGAAEVGLLRLVAQGVVGVPRDAVDAVRRLLAVQAQDLAQVRAAVALRSSPATPDSLDVALDAGAVCRTWPMRGTLHVLATEDASWLTALCAPRPVAASQRLRISRGVTAVECDRAAAVVDDVLRGASLSRADLLAAFVDAGLGIDDGRGYLMLTWLAMTRVICLGPLGGRDQLFVRCAEWLPEPRPLAGAEAVEELALRYFIGHGPATVADLVRWSGLSVTAVRTGVAAVRHRLATVDVDGTEHLLDPAVPDLLSACRREAAGEFFLPGFDEFLLGYADRSHVLAPEFAARIVPGGNGIFRPTVVRNGRVVGTWRWAGIGAERRREVDLFPLV